MYHLFKKYPMGHFATLTHHEQLVVTVLHIRQWTHRECSMLVLELSVDH